MEVKRKYKIMASACKWLGRFFIISFLGLSAWMIIEPSLMNFARMIMTLLMIWVSGVFLSTVNIAAKQTTDERL